MGRAYFTVLVSFFVLSHLVRVKGAIRCTEAKPLLREIPDGVSKLSECMLECTGMTYFKKLRLQDKRTIKFEICTEGDLGEYCWSKDLTCTIGESFQHAFALLPVNTSAVGHEMLEVKTTSPTVTRLQVHDSPTTIAESCGLLYEVTQLFSGEDTKMSVCLQVATNNEVQGDPVLKCPPYLVTFWQRNRPDRQECGG